MECPESITVKHTVLNQAKCKENFQYWVDKYTNVVHDDVYDKNLTLSKSVLPCHTFSYDSLKPIFGYDDTKKTFVKENARFLSSRKRLNLSGKIDYDEIPDHMSESIENGHDVFLFAYHGIHNPYHRIRDNIPVKPFGVFLKKDVEIFSCVHSSPWDITIKNSLAQQDVAEGNLDKYYLTPEDLRILKPIQIQKIEDLKNDFWYYFGNPRDWSTKGYGNKLFQTAGEMRYLDEILPESIAAILWPMWVDTSSINENLDLKANFTDIYPNITIVEYIYDKYENFVLSLVEASFYTQQFFLKNNRFPASAEVAKIKVLNS